MKKNIYEKIRSLEVRRENKADRGGEVIPKLKLYYLHGTMGYRREDVQKWAKALIKILKNQINPYSRGAVIEEWERVASKE